MADVKRMERVSALAVKAKTDRSVIPELWGEVERLIKKICSKYCRASEGNRLYDIEDLVQCSYFGFVRAIENYDESKGAFSTFLVFYIRNCCQRGRGRQSDPIQTAISLDAPLSHNNDNFSLIDTLDDEDDSSVTSFDAVEREMLVDVILDEADRLPYRNQTRVIREHTYTGRSLVELATELGITSQGVAAIEERAIFHLRRKPIIRELYNEYRSIIKETIHESAVSPYRVKSMSSFKTDFTSVVEAIVMDLA